MVAADGYILRIATEKWVDQVFNEHMEMSPAIPIFLLIEGIGKKIVQLF